MRFGNLKTLYEARDQNENKLFKYCSFEWILDLLKDGIVYSYDVSLRDQKIEDKNDGRFWIALTTKRSSNINQYLEEYGPCEVTFDKKLLKENNEIYVVNFSTEWLDQRPSITKFVTKGEYSNSKEYFIANHNRVNWMNTDNYSKRFFNDYMIDNKLELELILKDYTVNEIENYIYDSNYLSFESYIRTLGSDDELVIIKSPLKLVNDAVTQIIVPRRYKDKITQYEAEYKIRYE
jgi:hypothetical protein